MLISEDTTINRFVAHTGAHIVCFAADDTKSPADVSVALKSYNTQVPPKMQSLWQNVSATTFDHPFVFALYWIISRDFVYHAKTAVNIAQYATNRRNSLLHSDIIDEVLQRFVANQSLHANRNSVNLLVEHIEAPALSEGDYFEGGGRNQTGFAGILLEDEKIYAPGYQPKTRAIWLIDSWGAYMALERDLLDPTKEYDRHGFFFLMYTGDSPDIWADMRTMLQRLLDIYILNVDFIIVEDGAANVYTYFPFSANRCYAAEPKLHGSFGDITADMNELFPHKLVDMYQCEVSVATYDQAPFVLTEWDEATGALLQLQGIEGMLFTLMAEQMNFSIKIVLPTPRSRGEIFDNGTANGAAGLVVDGVANMTFLSYMIEKKRSEAMLASTSYMTCPIVVAIPKGTKMGPYERLIKPFRIWAWFLVSGSVLTGILVILCLKLYERRSWKAYCFGERNRIPFSNLLSSLYGVTMSGAEPLRNFPRFLLAMWLLYSMVLRNAYSGKLFSIMRDARARTTLKSIEEIVAKNYTFVLFPVLEELVRLVGATNIIYVDSGYNSQGNLFKRLQSDDHADFVFPVCEYYLYIYNKENMKSRGMVNTLDELLLEGALVIYMRHYSYFLRPFNDLLQQFLASGFLTKFERLYVEQLVELQEPLRVPLTLKMLKGLFVVYVALVLACGLVFCLEYFTYRWREARRLFHLLNR